METTMEPFNLSLPCRIGTTVYVIATCQAVSGVPDGTLYDSNGGPGTATGYYCPYEMEDSCPHEQERDGDSCDYFRYERAVFEDVVCGYMVLEDQVIVRLERTGYAAPVDLFGTEIFFDRSAADRAFAAKNSGGSMNG